MRTALMATYAINTRAPNTKVNSIMDQSSETNITKYSRRAVTLTVAAFVLLLGVPLFFYTTSIHRAELPVDELNKKLQDFQTESKLRVPIYIDAPAQTDSLQKAISKLVSEKWGLDNVWEAQVLEAPTTESYLVSAVHGTENKCIVSSESRKIDIVIQYGHPVEENLANLLLDTVFQDELDNLKSILLTSKASTKGGTHDLVLPYSSTYNLVFNLFVENGQPVDWEVDEAIASLQPLISALSHYTQFKISTQIQYYTKLHNEPVFDESSNSYFIPRSDLSTFINYGEWNLITHDVHRSINFLVFFPAGNYDSKPLNVEGSKTNSFLIPQWGGVYIYNLQMPVLRNYTYVVRSEQLLPIFNVFASQLLELFGVPKTPLSPMLRLESFNRIMCVKNLRLLLDNLSSLVTLSNSLNEISIPELTRTHMTDSLKYYDATLNLIRNFDFASAVEQSAKGVESSDKAFFEKEMVQQAYFPNEHKLAVFLPLLGPLASIILIGLLKTFKEIKQEKKESSSTLEEKKNL